MTPPGKRIKSYRSKNKNCWEFNNCGPQKEECAAYPDSGRSCAFMAGTVGNCYADSFDAKQRMCMSCAFYNSEYFENPEPFVHKYGWRIADDLF